MHSVYMMIIQHDHKLLKNCPSLNLGDQISLMGNFSDDLFTFFHFHRWKKDDDHK